MSALSGNGRLVLSGDVADADVAALRAFAEKGGNVILLGQKVLPEQLLPETETTFKEHRQEILTMNMPESTVFDGLDVMDPAWFTDGRHVPYVAFGRYSVDRFSPDVCVLAETLECTATSTNPPIIKRFGRHAAVHVRSARVTFW